MATSPRTMYPTSGPGWLCRPEATPSGISARVWTISQPSIGDAARCSSRLVNTARGPAACTVPGSLVMALASCSPGGALGRGHPQQPDPGHLQPQARRVGGAPEHDLQAARAPAD